MAPESRRSEFVIHLNVKRFPWYDSSVAIVSQCMQRHMTSITLGDGRSTADYPRWPDRRQVRWSFALLSHQTLIN